MPSTSLIGPDKSRKFGRGGGAFGEGMGLDCGTDPTPIIENRGESATGSPAPPRLRNRPSESSETRALFLRPDGQRTGETCGDSRDLAVVPVGKILFSKNYFLRIMRS